MMLRCPNKDCQEFQFFENAFCTSCGQQFDK